MISKSLSQCIAKGVKKGSYALCTVPRATVAPRTIAHALRCAGIGLDPGLDTHSRLGGGPKIDLLHII